MKCDIVMIRDIMSKNHLMIEQKTFDPHDPQYKKIGDIPEEQRIFFAESADETGFVTRSARLHEEKMKWAAQDIQDHSLRKQGHRGSEDTVTAQDLMHAEAIKINNITELVYDEDGHILCMMQDNAHQLKIRGSVQREIIFEGEIVRPVRFAIDSVTLDGRDMPREFLEAYQSYYGNSIMDRVRMDVLRGQITENKQASL